MPTNEWLWHPQDKHRSEKLVGTFGPVARSNLEVFCTVTSVCGQSDTGMSCCFSEAKHSEVDWLSEPSDAKPGPRGEMSCSEPVGPSLLGKVHGNNLFSSAERGYIRRARGIVVSRYLVFD